MFWFSFFIWSYKASGFSSIFGYYCEHFLPCGEDFCLFFVLRYFVSGVCLFVYYTCLLLFILGVLGPWEFSGGPGHILSVRMWLRCVEYRAGTIFIQALC